MNTGIECGREIHTRVHTAVRPSLLGFAQRDTVYGGSITAGAPA